MMQNDDYYMTLALKEAEKAWVHDEVPIGAIVVCKGQIIGRGYNQTEALQDPTAHAEMLAITAAATALGSRRLLDCTLYVTLEPCPMCAGAILLSRIPRLVYATADPKGGACGSLYQLTEDARLNHRCTTSSGIMQEESAELLKAFFARLRERRK